MAAVLANCCRVSSCATCLVLIRELDYRRVFYMANILRCSYSMYHGIGVSAVPPPNNHSETSTSNAVSLRIRAAGMVA